MSTPQRVRYLNELRALNELFRRGGMSRAELARALGLTRSTTGNVIADLRCDNLVVESPDVDRSGDARTGRPGVNIALNPLGGAFIGAEIGVDRLTVVVIDLAGREVKNISRAFPTADVPADESIDAAVGMIRAVADVVPKAQSIRGLCVALPALLDRSGSVINALLLGWRDVPLRSILVQRLGEDFPIKVENDAKAFGIADTYSHASTPAETTAVLLIETGVGGGIVVGGRVFRGGLGLAGEFGQMVLGEEGFYRGRTKPGHLESFIGKEAVLARYVWHGGETGGSIEDFLAALDQGEQAAISAAGDWGNKLALGLIQIASVLNPTSIVLGGSVSPIYFHCSNAVEMSMQHEFIEGFEMPLIRVSNLGPNATALGGALLMHQGMFSVQLNAWPVEGEACSDEPRIHSYVVESLRQTRRNAESGPAHDGRSLLISNLY